MSHDEGPLLRRTVEQLLATLPRASEVVVVDDASEDGSAAALPGDDPRLRVFAEPQRLGVARARNRGARAARGELLVFSDAHMELAEGWAPVLGAALRDPAAGIVAPAVYDAARPECVGFGQAWTAETLDVRWLPAPAAAPHVAPLLGGGFLALRRGTFLDLGGFDSGMRVWGAEDAELCMRAWALGLECRVEPSILVGHRFSPSFRYPVPAATVTHNRLRLGAVHFAPRRLHRLLRALRGADLAAAVRLLDRDDCWARRRALDSRRHRSEAWFFARFGVPEPARG